MSKTLNSTTLIHILIMEVISHLKIIFIFIHFIHMFVFLADIHVSKMFMLLADIKKTISHYDDTNFGDINKRSRSIAKSYKGM